MIKARGDITGGCIGQKQAPESVVEHVIDELRHEDLGKEHELHTGQVHPEGTQQLHARPAIGADADEHDVRVELGDLIDFALARYHAGDDHLLTGCEQRGQGVGDQRPAVGDGDLDLRRR
jgi:hypothetical protein